MAGKSLMMGCEGMGTYKCRVIYKKCAMKAMVYSETAEAHVKAYRENFTMPCLDGGTVPREKQQLCSP